MTLLKEMVGELKTTGLLRDRKVCGGEIRVIGLYYL